MASGTLDQKCQFIEVGHSVPGVPPGSPSAEVAGALDDSWSRCCIT
jgi:hypothetical protein